MKVLQRIQQFSFVIGIGLTVLSLFFLYTGDSILLNPERIFFESENEETLVGFYHQPAQSRRYGVLMLEGFGSDQVSMRSAANQFLQDGFQVFTFDFTGHGRSTGTLQLDNASTDFQSKQVIAALAQFQELSGLESSQIFLFGHSLGARVAVQAVVQNDLQVAGLILLGPQINVTPNVQSEFFTGTSDLDLPWIAGLGPEQPNVMLIIISGTLEDILPVTAAQALMSQLTGEGNIDQNIRYGGGETPSREWKLLPAVFHNFEIYSPKALIAGVEWTEQQIGVEQNHERILGVAARRIIFWISSIVGIVLFLLGARQFSENHQAAVPAPGVAIQNNRKFVLSKFWLWLPAIPIGAITIAPFFLLPIGLPLFNIYYVVFIAGYGVLTLLLYLFGKIPGSTGKLRLKQELRLPADVNWRYVIGLNLLVILFLLLFARSGWFWIPPTGDRLVWLLIFTPFTAIGFWSGAYDQALISSEERGKKRIIQWNGFLPFILYALLMIALSSWSGLINGMIGLLILWIAFQQGKITENLTGSRWIAALLQAFLLYLIILPQGVLFRF